jgi:DNA-binding MarR family transcriptional regulator
VTKEGRRVDDELVKQYILILFRFRKSGFNYPRLCGVNITELFVMVGIAHGVFNDGNGLSLTEIQHATHVSKAALSQMFKSLDRRGYIVRETDSTNRRKITVELTAAGQTLIDEAQGEVARLVGRVLSRFGEDKAWQLIALLGELSDISDEVKAEMAAESEGQSDGVGG